MVQRQVYDVLINDLLGGRRGSSTLVPTYDGAGRIGDLETKGICNTRTYRDRDVDRKHKVTVDRQGHRMVRCRNTRVDERTDDYLDRFTGVRKRRKIILWITTNGSLES